jgi:hypothetical protein
MTNKFLIPEDQVISLLATSRIKNKELKAALVLVLSQGYSYQDATQMTGCKSAQILGRRARELKEKFLQNECPEGWRPLQTFYPPSLEPEVSALKAKITVEQVNLIKKPVAKG